MRDEELDVPERMSTKKKKGERRVKSEILTERKEVEKGFGWIGSWANCSIEFGLI